MDIEEVYKKYFVYVYRYLVSVSDDKHLAEELTQETFFKALKKADSYRGEATVQSWLCQIAKNLYLDHMRKRSRFSYQEIGEADPDEKCFEKRLEDKEEARKIYRILHNLEEPYKEVFSLRVFGELPFREISDLFSKSESWAKMTYLRARKKIQEELHHEDHM